MIAALVCTNHWPSSRPGRRLPRRLPLVAAPAFLLLGRCCRERTGIAHVVPGESRSAVGTLDVCDAELVDVAVERIGDAAHACAASLDPPTRLARSTTQAK
jgi:hypothetical protein